MDNKLDTRGTQATSVIARYWSYSTNVFTHTLSASFDAKHSNVNSTAHMPRLLNEDPTGGPQVQVMCGPMMAFC